MHRKTPKWIVKTGLVGSVAAFAHPWLNRGAGITMLTTIIIAVAVIVAWSIVDYVLSN